MHEERGEGIDEVFSAGLKAEKQNSGWLDGLQSIQEILDAHPNYSALIHLNRKIVISNRRLHPIPGLEQMESRISGMPGENIQCAHLLQGTHACGESEQCRFCGINNILNESLAAGKKTEGETRITALVNNRLVHSDMYVTCSPVRLMGSRFVLLSMVDISQQKRNSILENVFFHDVLNRMGGINGVVQLLKDENNQPELSEYIDLLSVFSEMIIEDIQSQRYLKAAEKSSLVPNLQIHSAFDIVNSIRKQALYLPVMRTKQVEACSECSNFSVKTDSALLKRVLLNMVKNAAEASAEGSTITIRCKMQSDRACFSVNNPGMIPPDIQLQIFQRSFSTKGTGRGLGTYSMKLFGETYLGGRVFFKSTSHSGTTFVIELPLYLNGL